MTSDVSRPYLTMIFTGRNDNFGGDFNERFFRALRFNHESLSAAGVPHDFVFVEWRPLDGRPYLATVLADARIVRGCGNEQIVQMLCGDMYHLLRIYRKRSGLLPERKGQPFQEHWQIVRALQARDGQLAESAAHAPAKIARSSALRRGCPSGFSR